VSSYLLDTDICIYLIKKRSPKALARLQTLEMGSVCASSITLGELEYGAAKSTKPMQNKMALAQFLAPLEVLPFDESAAASYGPVRALLQSQGTPGRSHEHPYRLPCPGLGLDHWSRTMSGNSHACRSSSLRIGRTEGNPEVSSTPLLLSPVRNRTFGRAESKRSRF